MLAERVLSNMNEYVNGALQPAAAVLVLRCFPTVVWFGMAGEAVWWHSGLAATAYVAASYGAIEYAGAPAEGILVTYAVLLASLAASHFFAKRLRSRAGVGMLSLGLFALPSVMRSHAPILDLVVFWETMMAAYSYWVDVPPGRRNFREFVEFVVVNPALVYTRRGTRVSSARLNVLASIRMMRGVGFILLSGALQVLASRFESDMVAYSIALIGLYLAHAGLAHLQIGMMRQLGYVVPERYCAPYVARNPRDFWRRWNTYWGSWIFRYVFAPLVRLMRSNARLKRYPQGYVHGAAVLLSFMFVGAAHDIYGMASGRQLGLPMTIWFALNGCAIIAWDAVSLRAKSARYMLWPWLPRIAFAGLIFVLMNAREGLLARM